MLLIILSFEKNQDFKKKLLTEIYATKTNAACNISAAEGTGIVVESGLFARQFCMVMVKTHKHFIFMVLVVYLMQKDS